MINPNRDAVVGRLNAIDQRLSDWVNLIPDAVFNELADQLSALRVDLDAWDKSRYAKVKIFVATDDACATVVSTAAVDVIIATLSDTNNGGADIQRDTLRPLSEQEFLEFVHDTLSAEIQNGSVKVTEINETLK